MVLLLNEAEVSQLYSIQDALDGVEEKTGRRVTYYFRLPDL